MKRRLCLAALLALATVAFANAYVVVGGASEPSADRADCALVLGAGVRDDGSPSDVLRDRLDEALSLYREGRVRTILVTGDHARADYDEPNAMRRYLEANGVPSEAIFMDHAGLDTYSSMWRARRIFGASHVIVVTQSFHLSRAVWTARALGMRAEGHAADRRIYRSMPWLHAREILSRTKAVLDVTLERRPRHGGPPIDLAGDGRVTAG